MDKVRMYHDEVDSEIVVFPQAVEHHRRSGWKTGERPRPPESTETPPTGPAAVESAQVSQPPGPDSPPVPLGTDPEPNPASGTKSARRGRDGRTD